MKKLYRNKANAMLSGVFSGIGEYADIDPTILRLCYVFFTIFTGCFAGVIAYIIAAIIMPTKLAGASTKDSTSQATNVHDAEIVSETPTDAQNENTK